MPTLNGPIGSHTKKSVEKEFIVFPYGHIFGPNLMDKYDEAFEGKLIELNFRPI